MVLPSFHAAQLVFVAMAAFGMAVAAMGVALLMSLLGERSRWFLRVPSPLRFLLRMALALTCTVVFGLVWLVAWFLNRDAVLEPLTFTIVFVSTAIVLYRLYPRVTPELVAALKRHTDNEPISPN